MEIFIDSADMEEIGKWMGYGVIDGVTTNPTVMLKDGKRDYEQCAKEIAQAVDNLPVSVEVTTNDLEKMLEEARLIASWKPNLVVKIPVINEHGEPCLGVIRQLEEEGVKVNCTACLSFGQFMLAAKAGATYISLFVGRITDEGNDGPAVIRRCGQWLERWDMKSKIIVGSIRTAGDAQQASEAGAHVVTIPPGILDRMIDHKYTRATVAQFIGDAQKAVQKS